jgi:hypothetical protein
MEGGGNVLEGLLPVHGVSDWKVETFLVARKALAAGYGSHETDIVVG